MDKNKTYITNQEDYEFGDKLSKIGAKLIKNFEPLRIEHLISRYTMLVETDESKELLNNYLGENHNISVYINFSLNEYEGVKFEYRYKNIEIEPICHYVRPKESRFLTQLEVLRECIKQDKYNPDLRDLELL